MYLKYLEDNLNEKFVKEMTEYKKYLKLFYTKNSKCPADLKTPLEKKQDESSIELWCKLKSGKEWKISIKKPTVLNLNLEHSLITTEFKNKGILFKNNLKDNMLSSTYNPDNDKEVEKQFKQLKEYESKIEGINEIFNKQKSMIEDILKERQTILKNLATINVKKNKIYKNCHQISAEHTKKLKEISVNEKMPSEQRIGQIAKNTNLEKETVKNWITYFNFVMEYLNENQNLNALNDKMNRLRYKFNKINQHYIINPPSLYLQDEKIKIKMKKQKKS